MQKILKNAAQCKKCQVIIESKNRHDFIFCDCRSIFIDGGKEYLRRGGSLEYFIDLSEYDEDSPDAG